MLRRILLKGIYLFKFRHLPFQVSSKTLSIKPKWALQHSNMSLHSQRQKQIIIIVFKPQILSLRIKIARRKLCPVILFHPWLWSALIHLKYVSATKVGVTRSQLINQLQEKQTGNLLLTRNVVRSWLYFGCLLLMPCPPKD